MADFGTELDVFRTETREWLEANCPASMRTPLTAEETPWGGRKFKWANPDSKIWLDRMAEKGWTAPMWPKEYGGGGLTAAQARVLEQEMARIKARPPLFSFGIWMLGVQRYEHEVERTIKAIPLETKPKKSDVMGLETGEFIVCTRKEVEKVYVLPSWLPEEVGAKVATGELAADSDEVQHYKAEYQAEKHPDTLARPGDEQLILTSENEEDLTDLELRISALETSIL